MGAGSAFRFRGPCSLGVVYALSRADSPTSGSTPQPCRCPSAFSCLGARGAGPIMTDFFVTGRNWEHTLAVVLFLARAADVGSIYLVTPTLRLANPITRKLGWRFILL